jgi:hypothetical protein
MVPPERIELSTSPLPMVRSTTELRRPFKTRRTMPPADKMSTAPMAVSRYKVGMTKTPENPTQKPARQPTASEADRLERQAEALRANLRRRKDQSRGREGPEPEC